MLIWTNALADVPGFSPKYIPCSDCVKASFVARMSPRLAMRFIRAMHAAELSRQTFYGANAQVIASAIHCHFLELGEQPLWSWVTLADDGWWDWLFNADTPEKVLEVIEAWRYK